MKRLFFITFSLLASLLHAAEPQLIVDAKPFHWLNPIYSNDGNSLAFSALNQNEIWSFDLLHSFKPSRAARGDSIGRRFVFEPNSQDDRIVYRIRIKAHPAEPLRLLSASIHLFDPVTRTNNMGEILGPYLFENSVWYRFSPDGPFFDYQDRPRTAGPYWNRETQVLWVESADSTRIFTSPENEPVRGFEISPDGNYVAIVATTPEPILYLVALKTGDRTELGAGRWPSWSLNSKYLACLVDIRDETIIRVHDIEKHEHVALEIPTHYDPEYPALNPDGTKLVFTDGGRIFQIDLTE
ncbi:hypothetical protein EH220_05065 [bacterium]|nr:MAG: hypothetical protein EH220_05065 [bacterium]